MTLRPFALLLSFPAAHALAQTYDAATDFSATTNAGVWTYGETNWSGVFTPFTLHDAATSLTANGTGGSIVGWSAIGGGQSTVQGFPFVVKNAGATTYAGTGVTSGGSVLTIPAGALAMAPQLVRDATLRFTAPSAGSYLLNADFTRAENSGGAQSAVIKIAGTVVYNQSVNGNFGVTRSYSQVPVQLAAGQTVDFSIAANPSIVAPSFLVNARMTAVPEPATFAALGLGLAALVRRRTHR